MSIRACSAPGQLRSCLLCRSPPLRRLLSSKRPSASNSPADDPLPAADLERQHPPRSILYPEPRHGLQDRNYRLRRDRSTRVAFAAELLKAGYFPGQIAEEIQKRLNTDDRLAVGTIRGYLVERARTDPPFYATVAFNWKRISFEKGFLHDCETLEAAIARMDEIDEHRRTRRKEYKSPATIRVAARPEASAADDPPSLT